MRNKEKKKIMDASWLEKSPYVELLSAMPGFDPHWVQQHSFPSADSGMAVVSFWQKKAKKYWLTAKRRKPAQEKFG